MYATTSRANPPDVHPGTDDKTTALEMLAQASNQYPSRKPPRSRLGIIAAVCVGPENNTITTRSSRKSLGEARENERLANLQ